MLSCDFGLFTLSVDQQIAELDAVASLETASCGENGLRAAVSKSPSRDRPDGDGRDGRGDADAVQKEEEKQALLAKKQDMEEIARKSADREEALRHELDALEKRGLALATRLDAARADLSPASKKRLAEAVSIRRAASTMLTCERDSLQEEVRLLKSQSMSLEEKVARLSKQLGDAKAATQRGDEETAQLRRELLERREERAAFAAQQAAHARTGAGLRVQASALDDHVLRLTKAVEKEQELLAKDKDKLLNDQELTQSEAHEEKLLSRALLQDLPARLHADHAEVYQYKDLAGELQQKMQECAAKLQRFRRHQEHLAFELSRWRKTRKQVEAGRDAAHASRLQAEQDLATVEREVEQLTKQLDQAEAQRLRTLEDTVLPLRASCARLADRELQLVVQDHLGSRGVAPQHFGYKANAYSTPPRSQVASQGRRSVSPGLAVAAGGLQAQRAPLKPAPFVLKTSLIKRGG